MVAVVLFHHAHGRTPGVEAFAARLGSAVDLIVIPDMYEGRTFVDLDDGIAHAESIGFGTISDVGPGVLDGIEGPVVCVGISLGVLPAQKLAQTSDRVLGAVLIGACLPPTYFADGWPAGVRVQVHAGDADEIFAGEGDLTAAEELVASTEEAALFTYRRARHLFVDETLPDWDPTATDLLVGRVASMLDGF